MIHVRRFVNGPVYFSSTFCSCSTLNRRYWCPSGIYYRTTEVILSHNHAYLDTFRRLGNPSIFRTMIYSEALHIQNQRHTLNPGVFRTLAYSEPEAYS